MKDDFFQFLLEPSKEAFLRSRKTVVEHADYNPYGLAMDTLLDLLVQNEFQQVVDSTDINLLLSPRAHSYKFRAYKELGMEKEAEMEALFARRIVECILLTGEGSKDEPYVVCSVQDQRDVLGFLREEQTLQSLIRDENKIYDKIETSSGKTFFFDITDVYHSILKVDSDEFLNRMLGDETEDEDLASDNGEKTEYKKDVKSPPKKP
jgi:hypothetical protein